MNMITREGKIAQLKLIRDKNSGKNISSALAVFEGGFAKFIFHDEEVPDGLMLRDKVSLVINIKNDDENSSN